MAYTLKPGYMRRATIAFALLNAVLILVFFLIWVLFGDHVKEWYLSVPLIVGAMIAEATIIGSTIGPIIQDWIKQRGDWDK